MARTSSSSAMTSMPETTRGEANLLARHPVSDDSRELLALVFLEEVAAARDGGVGLARTPGHVSLERTVAAPCDRVLVGKGGQERLFPRAQHLPRVAVGFRGGIV